MSGCAYKKVQNKYEYRSSDYLANGFFIRISMIASSHLQCSCVVTISDCLETSRIKQSASHNLKLPTVSARDCSLCSSPLSPRPPDPSALLSNTLQRLVVRQVKLKESRIVLQHINNERCNSIIQPVTALRV